VKAIHHLYGQPKLRGRITLLNVLKVCSDSEVSPGAKLNGVATHDFSA
jgi:hypothetical protein